MVSIKGESTLYDIYFKKFLGAVKLNTSHGDARGTLSTITILQQIFKIEIFA